MRIAIKAIGLTAALASAPLLLLGAPDSAAAAKRKLSAPTKTQAWIGRLLVPVSARVAPRRSARAVTAVQPIAPLGRGGASLLVTRVARVDGEMWVKVLLPVRPNGTEGWVPADNFRFHRTKLRVLIDQSDRRLTVFSSNRVIMGFPIAIGKRETPTPTGRFAVAEMIRTNTPGAFLGPIVFPLTGYSRVLNEYAGGNGRVAMHGTSLPALIGTRASHGCIRINNRNVVRLSRIVRPGTPVTIRH